VFLLHGPNNQSSLTDSIFTTRILQCSRYIIFQTVRGKQIYTRFRNSVESLEFAAQAVAQLSADVDGRQAAGAGLGSPARQLLNGGVARKVAEEAGLEVELANLGQQDGRHGLVGADDEADVARAAGVVAARAALGQEGAEFCDGLAFAAKKPGSFRGLFLFRRKFIPIPGVKLVSIQDTVCPQQGLS
jgi:hypothetical protein